jgi:SAM-dependent methyltransferase
MDANDWNERYGAIELVWGVAPNRFVERELAPLAPGRALDLACGEGRNAIWLASRGWEVTAIDFADVAIAKGRRLAEAEGVTIEWVVDDVTRCPLPSEAFDVVLVAYLQLAAPARDEVVRRAAGAVAPGGTFLLVAHDSRNLTDGHGGPQDPAVLYRADDVVRLLDGFDVVHAGEVRRPVTTADGATVEAIDCLVRATRRTGSPSA